MTTVLLIITTLGFTIGILLGYLASRLSGDEDPIVVEIEAMMPGSQCAQCGFAGCAQAAQALVEGAVAATVCPPGGAALAKKIADRLGLVLDAGALSAMVPQVATVGEELCIGCTKCSQACPTDAIIGAPKQIHNVIVDYCTGCGLCVEVCPTETLHLHGAGSDLQTWRWPKPAPRAA